MRFAAPSWTPTLRRAAFLLATAASMMACTSSTSTDNMTLFSLTAGDGQSVSNGAAAAQPLTVTVLDEFNNPVAGATVTWSLDSGSGTISNSSSLTAANGQATVTFTGGATTGDAVVTASMNGFQTVKFTEHVS
jgi:adhesin/invasin